MGAKVDPSKLTESGEKCLERLCELPSLSLPTAQLVTVIGTVVEAHVSRVLSRLIALSGVSSSEFGRQLLKEQVDKMDGTWSSRDRWLKDAFGLAYAGTDSHQDLQTLIDVRNAVVHGDGSLTDRQARDIKDLLALRADFKRRLDATLRNRVEFSEASKDRAMSIARKFIVQFDSLVLDKHPDAQKL